MIPDHIKKLLSEFAVRANLPDISFNDDALCHLVINDEYPLSLRYNANNNRVTLFSELATIDPDNVTTAWLSFVLNSAYNSFHEMEPGVGKHPQSNSLVAFFHLDVESLNVDSLETSVVYFIEWQAKWLHHEKSLSNQSPSHHNTIPQNHSLRV